MGVFDQAVRYAAKLDPVEFFRGFTPEFAAGWEFREWADTSTVVFPGEPDRICDTVAEFVRRSDSAVRCLLDVEMQSTPHVDMVERQAEYAWRLRREIRFGSGKAGKYQVVGVLVTMTGPRQPELLDMTEPDLNGAGPSMRLFQVHLPEMQSGESLDEIETGTVSKCLLPWIPLMAEAEEDGIIERWKELASADDVESQRRSDYGGLALVFAELAGVDNIWKQSLEGWNVVESQQVLEWQEQASAKTHLETRIATRKSDLLQVIRNRFGGSPEDIELLISEQDSFEELGRWLDAALNVNSVDEFREAVQA